jgi:hypothetical protein
MTKFFSSPDVNLLTSNKPEKKDFSLDSDSDGLKDWEEILWGFDINNPDTDGDGILDGKEIKNEIKNEESKINNLSKIEYKELVDPKIKYNQSKVTSIENNLELPNPNKTTTNKEGEPVQDYQIKELSFKNYGNEVGEIINIYLFDTGENMQFLGDLINDPENPQVIESLKKSFKNYHNLAQSLFLIEYPKEVENFHNTFTNGYSEIYQSIIKLAEGSKSGEGWNNNLINYNQKVTNIARNMAEIGVFFKERGVIFNFDEAGVIFNLISF